MAEAVEGVGVDFREQAANGAGGRLVVEEQQDAPGWARFFDFANERAVETHDDDAWRGQATRGGWSKQFVQFGENGTEFRRFQLEEEFVGRAEQGDDLGEFGDAFAGEFQVFPGADFEGLQLRERAGGGAKARLARSDAAGVGVVEDGEAAVAGEAHVNLDPGGAGGEGETDGGERVFGGAGGGSAMRDDFHRSGVRK